MKIVIDGRLWSESGIGRYLRNLVINLQELDKENTYFILLRQKDYKTVRLASNFQKVRADFKWYSLEEQLRLPGLLTSLKPDLVHFPHFNVPLLYRGKYVVTIHDLIHQHFQTRETTTLNPILHTLKKAGYKKVFSGAVKNAQKIITPSKFVKEQLEREWRINPEKIVVTYEGVDEGILQKVKDIRKSEEIEKKFKLNKPYLFYVGNAQPHKNILQLIKAYFILKEKHPKLLLVLAGPPHYFWEKIWGELGKRRREGIIFTGFVSDEELVTLYKNAQCFVMPSLEEGFGIPILEAMACGCPVISSDTGSLPEVGGEAVLYFNPLNIRDVEATISQILDNEKLRKEMIKKGEHRFREFSWTDLTKKTLDIYNHQG